MAFIRVGFHVDVLPIEGRKREGKGHIKPATDGPRVIVPIVKVTTLYVPLRLSLPTSLAVFALGISYYLYTYTTRRQFTNMSLLLFSAVLIMVPSGFISEQIAARKYKNTGD